MYDVIIDKEYELPDFISFNETTQTISIAKTFEKDVGKYQIRVYSILQNSLKTKQSTSFLVSVLKPIVPVDPIRPVDPDGPVDPVDPPIPVTPDFDPEWIPKFVN